MEPVATPVVGGVTLRRHQLDIEAERLTHIARRLGLRLRRWFLHEPEFRPKLRVAVTSEGIVMAPVVDSAGKPVLEVNLPDEDWRESFKLYQKAVADLLQEQRARAALKPSARPPLTDAEADAELLDYVRSLPDEVRRELVATGTIDASVVETATAPVDEEI